MTSTPYAVQSLNATNAVSATTAQNATQLGGLAASQYVITNDSRLSDARNPLPNSANYIQNTTTQQPATNFNITGDGLIGGRLGLGTSGPSTKLQVHTTGLDQHLYLSSAAPSLVLGNNEVRSSATMNSLFALSTAAGLFGVEARGLMIANYGNARGNIYINSNYQGNGLTNVILQPFGGYVGIGTTTPTFPLHVEGGSGVGIKSQSDYIAVWGISTLLSGIGVLGESDNGVGVYGSSQNGRAGYFNGKVGIRELGSGGSISLCFNSYPTYEIAYCSSSLRYKTDVQPFVVGLDIINRLRPITFTWKQGGLRDLGFGAEEVEKVEPLLVTYNPKGEVEGVKYDRITVALVNAVREQQTQIEQQQREIETLKRRQHELEALKALVCADHPNAEVCQSN